jgi:hypothetical protein
MQLELRFEQRFTQRRDIGLIGFFINDVADFGGLEHGQLLQARNAAIDN